MKWCTVFLLLFLTGCTMDGGNGEVTWDFNECKDTRDGEVFVLVGDTVRNIRYGIGTPHCFDVDDTTGHTRTMCSNHLEWIKCEIG